MSLTTKRAEIVECLNGIEVLKGYETEPGAKKPGDSWPQFFGKTWESGVPESTWRVFIVLPQDEKKAIQWLEDNLDDIHDGLQWVENAAGYVDGAHTVNLGKPDSPVYGLEITLRSE